jgi:4'-phosphopantetheinyl transferase
VTVWQVRLDGPDSLVSDLSVLLTAEERERADRGVPAVRRRRVLLRAALRLVLAARLGVPAAEVALAAAAGRPRLTAGHPGLDVSCSASRGLGLIAVGEGVRVGVDVEAVDPEGPAAARSWTAVEALSKAEGTGLRTPLPAGDPDTLARGAGPFGRWHVLPVGVPFPWVATLAVGPRTALSPRTAAVSPIPFPLEASR